MNSTSKKVKVAMLSIISNTSLIIAKVIAGIMSGSVSIISEAIHSSMDLLASIIAFISVKISGKPADKDHPYGHGKAENFSGLIEGLLIFIAAFLIIQEAVKKLLHPTRIEETWVAVGVMLLSALVNTIVARKLYKVAKEEDSIALEADALHLKTDVYTSLGVGLGLILIAFTGMTILDPIVAIAVACLIIKESWVLCRNAFLPLMDSSLPLEDEEMIKKVMEKYDNEILDYHMLRTRKAGNMKYIDFHMTVQEELTVKESHALSERIETDLENSLKHTNVNIHIEPGMVNKEGKNSEPSDSDVII
ncbi:MAG: cation diffusion facilitator family transporter [Deltaproteobacteria bacterium]